MIIARWKIDARFGHKSDVLESMNWWKNEIGQEIGWDPERTRTMTGSIGANESCVVTEVELESISALDESWNKLRTLDKHRKWGKEIEPHIVSGSHRWEVYRVE